MPRVLLIDDEPLARSIVREYLGAFPDMEIVAECNDGFEGLKAIQQWQPELIFLDIQMPRINGFEMLELLPHPPAVIFTTAYDEYAMKAFETHAVDYLLKPFSPERLSKAIEKWRSREAGTPAAALLETAAQSPGQRQRVVVRMGQKIQIIPVTDIHYFEAADDFVKLHTSEGVFLKNKTLSFFEQTLDKEQYVRCHRSYILNIQQIHRIDHHEKDNYVAVLVSGAIVPVSRSGYGRLKEVLGL